MNSTKRRMSFILFSLILESSLCSSADIFDGGPSLDRLAHALQQNLNQKDHQIRRNLENAFDLSAAALQLPVSLRLLTANTLKDQNAEGPAIFDEIIQTEELTGLGINAKLLNSLNLEAHRIWILMQNCSPESKSKTPNIFSNAELCSDKARSQNVLRELKILSKNLWSFLTTSDTFLNWDQQSGELLYNKFDLEKSRDEQKAKGLPPFEHLILHPERSNSFKFPTLRTLPALHPLLVQFLIHYQLINLERLISPNSTTDRLNAILVDSVLEYRGNTELSVKSQFDDYHYKLILLYDKYQASQHSWFPPLALAKEVMAIRHSDDGTFYFTPADVLVLENMTKGLINALVILRSQAGLTFDKSNCRGFGLWPSLNNTALASSFNALQKSRGVSSDEIHAGFLLELWNLNSQVSAGCTSSERYLNTQKLSP